MQWRWSSFEGLGVHLLHDLLRLRAEVFVVEQACAYADVDGFDPLCWHLVALEGGAVVGALRAFPPGAPQVPGHLAAPGDVVIGRVVVARSHRSRGVGAELMRRVDGHAREQFGPAPRWLAAQAHLRGWYEGLGYAVCGPAFDEDGIPHVPMRKG